MTEPSSSETESARPLGLDRATVVRLIRFGVVGLSGVFVNWAVFELFFRALLAGVEGDARLVSANVAGVIVSIFTNFVLNDRWTWGDRQKGQLADWFHRVVKYYVSASVAALVQIGVTWASYRAIWSSLNFTLGDYDPMPTLALFTGIGCGMVINFVASHFWAFKDAEQ